MKSLEGMSSEDAIMLMTRSNCLETRLLSYRIA